ncbi:hypothetical protein SDC9_97724 [bioreactor metagenome]|uniref:Uncharacterized protein n=1 Tax=bioreactor metagenome TaxID=1076179 RepID=A0A645AE47_9ZZZZ
MLRFQGDVFLAVFCRFAIGAGVDAKHTEIAGMTGPHPVVGIASEISNAQRRIHHQPDIGINLINEKIILVSVEKRLDIGFLIVRADCSTLDPPRDPVNYFFTLHFSCFIRN